MCWCYGAPPVRDIHSSQAADGKDYTDSWRLEELARADSLAQKHQELLNELAQERRERAELLRRLDMLGQQEQKEIDNMYNYPRCSVKSTVVLDKPSMIVRGRQLYIRRTILEDARYRKGWDAKDAYQKWNEYIDDAGEREEAAMRKLGFTPEVLKVLRWREPLCTQRDANAATQDTIAECIGSSACSGEDSSPWQQLHDIAAKQQSFVDNMALMGHSVDDDYS